MAGALDDDQWSRILELAHQAADLPTARRAAFVEASCDDPLMAAKILELASEFQLQPEERLDTGAQIGRFTITGRIGRGGMGEVFAALDTDLGRTVALKVLTAEAVSLPGAADRIVKEARIASALNHPNIVTVHDVVRTGATVALVMEHVPGSSLRALAGALPLPQCLDVARQIAAALAAAHAAGIIHRDIKPENVIVRPDGHVKVLDFGLARSLAAGDSASHTGSFAGTFAYMSPEQCVGAGLTPASDIFSFGIALYELACGHRPFSDASPFETMQAIVYRTPPGPSTWSAALPVEFDALVLRMLEKRPAERPSATEVARSLDAIAGKGSGFLPKRRAWRRAALAACGAAVLLAGAVRFWLMRQQKPEVMDFVQLTSMVPAYRVTASTISGDGKFCAYANVEGVFLRAMQSRETQQLRAPENFIVDHLAWYPDGVRLVASGVLAEQQAPAAWLLSIAGATPRRILPDARYATPSPDGRSLAFLSEDRAALWVAGADGEQPTKLIEAAANDSFGCLFWSASGRSVLVQRRRLSHRDLGPARMDRHYERTVESIDVQSRQVVFRSSEFWIESAEALPDGRLRFLRYAFPGSLYANELWEVRSDPDTGAFRGEPRKIGNPVERRGGLISSMSATDDGSVVAVIRSNDEESVYVSEYRGAPPRFQNAARLTLDTRRSYPHAWTPDSGEVIFESDRDGTWDIFRQRIGQVRAVPVAANPTRAEALPQVTPDGKWILYAAAPSDSTSLLDTILRVPIQGGAPARVLGGADYGEFRCSVRPEGRCVLRMPVGREAYRFQELDPIQGAGRELARGAWTAGVVGDWDVSPDGTRVALPNHDTRSARIFVVGWDGRPSSEIALQGASDLVSVNWAADGNGWFVSMNTTVGRRLIYAYPDGRTRPIGNIQGWATPAPNGHLVAYMDRVTPADVWTMLLK